MKLLAAVLIVLLSGCKSAPETEAAPQATIIQRIFQSGPVQVRYVPLPASWTVDCIEVAKSKDPNVTFEDEATRLSNERLASIQECNTRWAKVRQKQGQLKEQP